MRLESELIKSWEKIKKRGCNSLVWEKLQPIKERELDESEGIICLWKRRESTSHNP